MRSLVGNNGDFTAMTHEEKAQEIVEFYIGDCACEQDHPCTYCQMVHDIEKALASAEKKGREEGQIAVNNMPNGYWHDKGWNEAISAAVKVAETVKDDFGGGYGSHSFEKKETRRIIAESINKLKRG